MQRYWSDNEDEDEEKKDDSDAILEKLKEKVTKRKLPPPPQSDDNDSNNESLEPPSKKKNRKKKKKSKKANVEEETPGFTVLGEASLASKRNKVKRVLPGWLANPDVVSVDLNDQQMAVDDLAGLDDKTKNVLKSNGIKYFFPVQRQIIPRLLDQKLYYRPPDLCVSAPTGSGKTLAYVLPIVQALRRRRVPRVRAMVVVPVQDLASQVFKVFQTYCEGSNLKVKLLSAGQKSFAQEQQELVAKGTIDTLYHSLADIVVATPGRIVDHIQHTVGFSLEALRYLIVDEADRVMEDIQNDWLTHVEEAVYSNNSSRPRPGPLNVANADKQELPLQKLLFSATLSQNPEKLQTMNLYEPKLFTSVVQPKDIIMAANKDDERGGEFVGKYTTPAELKEVFVRCQDPLQKPLYLINVIQQVTTTKALVFTKSIDSSHKLCVLLQQFGLNASEMSSKIKEKRSKVISKFRSGKVDILVSTDALARGIDIGTIDHVISYDCPAFVKTYIHRVGRTARAGKSGTAITLVDKKEERKFLAMIRDAGKSGLAELPMLQLDHTGYEEATEKAAQMLQAEKK